MLVWLLVRSASAITVSLCNSGCDHTTLGSALAASPDIIEVSSTTVYLDQPVFSKSTRLVSIMGARPVLRCTDTSPDGWITATGAYALIVEGFDIEPCDARRAANVPNNASLTLRDVTITAGPSAHGGSGGVILVGIGANLTLEMSVINGGSAPGYPGGQIFGAPGDGTIIIDQSELFDGLATNGGCIAAANQQVTIRHSRLQGCTATNQGGALYTDNSTDVFRLEDNKFIDGSAVEGGLVYFRGAVGGVNAFFAHRNVFCGGRADVGAGIYMYRAWDDFEVIGNVFIDLKPSGTGHAGAIHSGYIGGSAGDHGVIRNNHFLNVQASSNQSWAPTTIGLYTNINYVNISNNLFASTGSNGREAIGSQVSGGWNGGSTDVRYNNWYQFSGTHLDPQIANTGTASTFAPMLNSANYTDCDGDFRPAPGSPLINAGDPALIDSDGTRSDIGAFPGYNPNDSDGDGHDAVSLGGDDCDDTDSNVHPGITEVCDGQDNDCDGDADSDAIDRATWAADADADGFGHPTNSILGCTVPSGGSTNRLDCDDSNALAFPGGSEVCDGQDNDCNGDADSDAIDRTAWYLDQDGDGFGDASNSVIACDQPANHVTDNTDCLDSTAAAAPGEVEICDDIDNDCNGDVDGDAIDRQTWYADADGDGFGDPATGVVDCDMPASHVLDHTDCLDTSDVAAPGQIEICDDIDNDCNGDVDGDAIDRPTWYADSDGDTYGDPNTGAEQCDAPSTDHVTDNTDCRDDTAAAAPGLVEICDGIDNDCNNDVDTDAIDRPIWYADSDGDGFGDADQATEACEQPSDHVANDSDCLDSSALAAPGLDEVCDGLDNDCDGSVDEQSAVDAPLWWTDGDEDGYGENGVGEPSCDAPVNRVSRTGDCDDANDIVWPGAPELCDGFDNDCNDVADDNLDFLAWYLDGDGDGYGDPGTETVACIGPAEGWVLIGGDCEDSVDTVSPGATEVCDDIDNNCDGQINENAVPEIWYDGIDQDCDGNDTDQDGDGFDAYEVDGDDCDDTAETVYPGALEVVDGIDNDCDGLLGWGPPTGSGCSCESVAGGGTNAWWTFVSLSAVLLRRQRHNKF